jgi:hypothetical protein
MASVLTGRPWAAAFLGSIRQLAETDPARFWLAASKKASAKPGSVLGASPSMHSPEGAPGPGCRPGCDQLAAAAPGCGPRCDQSTAALPGCGPRCDQSTAALPGCGPRYGQSTAALPGCGPRYGQSTAAAPGCGPRCDQSTAAAPGCAPQCGGSHLLGLLSRDCALCRFHQIGASDPPVLSADALDPP